MNSKKITDYQLTSEEELIRIISKYSLKNKKPRPKYIEDLRGKILDYDNKKIIIDCFCGIGESSYQIARSHPECLVIGIDKSLDRLERNNSFKDQKLSNLLLFRADVADFYPEFLRIYQEEKLEVIKQYFLYPNPWPKKKNLKMRFYANGIIPYIFKINSELELRSNWGRMIIEFSYLCKYYQRDYQIESLLLTKYLTPFERKYSESNQSIFSMNIKTDF